MVLDLVKVQIDLTEEENTIVDVYKLSNHMKTKQEAIKKMIQYFEVDIKPKNLRENEYFK
jgi:hypothetical protein